MFSKSLYLRGLQCPKSLWLKKNKPEALSVPDDSQIAIFTQGDQVGQLACSLFPNGKKIEFDGSSFSEKIAQTKEWIDNGEQVIYEATFQYHDVLVMVDILCIRHGKFHLYEVKSSTSLKETYLHDVSIQYYVLNGLGYEIESVNVMHINNEYIRGEMLDVKQFFTCHNVTEIAKDNQKNIPQQLEEFKKVIQGHEPQNEIGLQCFSPYECDAYAYCWQEQRKIPDYSVFNITYLKMQDKFKLYHQGIIKIDEICNPSAFGFKQRIQIECEKSQEVKIDVPSIQSFLKTLKYPIYHLDFETFQQSIPQWSGISAYMQIPFQFSIHKDWGNGEVEHFEFLAKEGEDPRRALAEKLIEIIPLDCMVMAYNMSFEKGVIKQLARTFADLKEPLETIANHIVDLMKPFADKSYYHPKMQGSHSIKKVLPALVPEMQDAYANLDLIHHGGEAMEVFPNLCNMDENTKAKYRQALLQYCKLDTLAMVKVLEKLREVGERGID